MEGYFNALNVDGRYINDVNSDFFKEKKLRSHTNKFEGEFIFRTLVLHPITDKNKC